MCLHTRPVHPLTFRCVKPHLAHLRWPRAGHLKTRGIFSIHLPLLAGQIRLLLILVFVGNIQDFTGILILTGGGPLDSTYVPGLEMYYHATRFNNLGYAAAIGVVLFVVIMVFTVLLNKFLRPAAEYQA